MILEFFNNLEKIIELENIFLNITLKSRIIRLKQKIKEEEKDSKKNKEEKAIKKNLMLEIYKDYDNSLEEFTNSIHKIITDIIGGRSEVDLLILVIRKLPVVLEYFGTNKAKDFNMLILNNFNKREWRLQKEILIQIPKMLKILGRKNLVTYILPCIDSLISNNSEEMKIIELIKTLNKFINMEYLYPKEIAPIFNRLYYCFIHPNINIRFHIMELLKNILSKISKEEAYMYFYRTLSRYVNVPIIDMDIKYIQNIFEQNISRVLYQLELKIIKTIMNLKKITNIKKYYL